MILIPERQTILILVPRTGLRRKTAMSLDGLLTLLLIAPFLILGAREIYWSLKGVPRDSL